MNSRNSFALCIYQQGSLFVLIDILRVSSRRSLYHQIMASMSFFDLIGSTAYAFTTLPIPSESMIQGAQGNDATCTAQGFFIQVGTVTGYMNVSLAFYYFLIIQKEISESRLTKYRPWFFVCPIVVGMTFAFAGTLKTLETCVKFLFTGCELNTVCCNILRHTQLRQHVPLVVSLFVPVILFYQPIPHSLNSQ